MDHIKGMKTFYDYIDEHGTIDGTDPKGLKALEGAGFTIKLDTVKN